MSRKYFGTDGIRGKVGDVLTAEFVLKLGWAAGKVLGQQGERYMLIGKDTRSSGYMYESALEAGLSAAGVDIRLLGPMPTPGIAYLTQTLRASGGIVISASHNPYYDNGIKFLSSKGNKLPDKQEQAIERLLGEEMDCVDSAVLGKAQRITDAAGRYTEYCKSIFPSSADLGALKIVVDCAHGATYHIAPDVFRELGAEVIAIGVEPDGININNQYGATSPAKLQAEVLAQKADVGIALDGDGDRLIMVDHKGEIVDGDEILYILAAHKFKHGFLKGGVVGTVMTNIGLEIALKDMGIPFKRAKVGDRFVFEMLQQEGWILGGESSGHILSLDKTGSGDGIISALQVLNCMVSSQKALHDLKLGMTKYPQVLINVPLKKKGNPCETSEVKNAVTVAEKKLGEDGRVLLRLSGTEPLARVMVEGKDQQVTESLAKELASVVAAV